MTPSYTGKGKAVKTPPMKDFVVSDDKNIWRLEALE